MGNFFEERDLSIGSTFTTKDSMSLRSKGIHYKQWCLHGNPFFCLNLMVVIASASSSSSSSFAYLFDLA